MQRIKKYSAVIIIILIIAAVILLFPYLSGLSVDDIIHFAPDSYPLAALAIIGLYAVKPAAMFIPLIVLFAAAGLIFPLGIAFAVTICGLFIEMSIGYAGGKRLGIERVLARTEKNDKIKNFLANQRNIGPSVCFFASFLPFPVDVLNMFLGAADIKYPKFLVFMYFGLLPLMLPGVLFGSAFTWPLSIEFIIPFIVCIIINAVIYNVYKKRRSK